MEISAFKPFFSFPAPSGASKLAYGLTHFYYKPRPHFNWNPFRVIKKATSQTGEVLLGQIPTRSFHKTLIDKLSNGGLILSCADHFELSGVGAMAATIPPYAWTFHKVDHHHLLFSDRYSKTESTLIILALQKMLDVHQSNGSIYIHCKPDSSRSIFLAALFSCITDEDIKQQLVKDQDDSKIALTLKNKMQQLNASLLRVHLDKAQTSLGIHILKYYISYWQRARLVSPLVEKIDFPVDEFNAGQKLNANQALDVITQSDEYKFMWVQAYRNPDVLPIVQSFADRLYQHVEQNKDKKFVIQEIILSVFAAMEQNKAEVIKQLHKVYYESELFVQDADHYSNLIQCEVFSLFNELIKSSLSCVSEGINQNENVIAQLGSFHLERKLFINEINQCPALIQEAGLNLLNVILKSDISCKEKTLWMKKSNALLKNPEKALLGYKKAMESALQHPSLALQIIGISMMALGVAIIMVSLLAGVLASGGLLGIALATVGAATFGGAFIALGALLYERGLGDDIATRSRVLIDSLATEEKKAAPSLALCDEDKEIEQSLTPAH